MYCTHPDLNVLTPSLPTRRSCDLYGWGGTGKVKPGVAAPSLGTRFTTTNVPNLRPGEFLVKVSDLSLAKLMGIITTQLEPGSNQLSDLVTPVNDLYGTVDTHTQQIGQLQSQVVGIVHRIISEYAAPATQLDGQSVGEGKRGHDGVG